MGEPTAMPFRTIRPAHRMEAFRYAVLDIAVLADEVARTRDDMLYLNLGDPLLYDFETPRHIVEAGARAMRDQHNSYAPPLGTPEALDAVMGHAERKGIGSVQSAFITTGATEAAELALTALVNAGESVLVPCPGYPLYTAVLARLEAKEVSYFLDEEHDWQPDLQDIRAKIDDTTRAIVLVSPNNPTGAVADRQTCQGILQLAREHDLVIIADEIYDRLLLDGQEHVSIASLDPAAPVVTINGLSKNYLGPGLRIGWGVVSGDAAQVLPLIDAVGKLLRARVCANHPLQAAIPAALDGPQDHIDSMIARLRRRRDITYDMLNAIEGITCARPTGAFYGFPRLHMEGGDDDWVKELIRQQGVVVVPGSGFGQAPGTKHFRIVSLPPEHVLIEAYERIAVFAESHGIR